MLTGSFVVADEPAGSYSVTAVGNPEGDSAYAVFTVRPGTPSITLDSQTGAPGSTVHVSGTSFSANDTSCSLSDGGAGENETCSIAVGTVTASFVVANAAAGPYTITVTGTPEGDWASQTFTVTSSPMSISLNESSAPVGAGVQVSGIGFPSSDANCTLSGEAVASANCSLSSGVLSGSFDVANVTTGLYTITATSSPSGDFVSANFTVTAPPENQNSTTVGVPDFSIALQTSSVTLTAGASQSVMVNVTSLNGFSSPVTLSAAWVGTAPAGVNLTLASPITPTPSQSTTDPLQIVSASNASAGSFDLQVTGKSGTLVHAAVSNITVQILHAQGMSTTSTTSNSTRSTTSFPNGPTCAVSSATSGSELAPLAQTLRSFRDQSILRTRTGEAFFTFFNSWYYSFSPPVASYLYTHPTERTIFRYALYPLVGVLYASYYSYLVVSPLNNEVASLTAGLVAAGMLGLIYIAIPMHLTRRILRRERAGRSLPELSRLAACFVISSVLVGMTYLSGGNFGLGMATVSLILWALSLGAALGMRALSFVDFASTSPQIAILPGHVMSSALRRIVRQ